MNSKFNGSSINLNPLKQTANQSPEQQSRSRLKPGRFVRLKGQPHDLPDFVLERYLGTFCWIRQQAWGQVIWKVSVAQIAD